MCHPRICSRRLLNLRTHNNQHSTIWLTIPFVGDLTTQLVKKLKRKLRRCLIDPNVDIRIKQKTTKLCFFTSNKDKTPRPLSRSNQLYMNSLAPVAILRTSAKRTELCLSAHKNMRSRTKKALYINICTIVIRSKNTYKVYTAYRTFLSMRTNNPPSIAMNKEFLTQTVRGNTNIIDSDDNWNLLLYKEAYHIIFITIFEHWFKSQ